MRRWAQDGLYTLAERSGHDETVTVVGSIAGLLHAADDYSVLLETFDHPLTRIVSLTITEDGYGLNPATKRLDLDHATIAADLADPGRPHSAIGILVESFRRRMATRSPAFTALSCDSIQHNGNVLRQAVFEFARHRDPALSDWIESHASIACSANWGAMAYS